MSGEASISRRGLLGTAAGSAAALTLAGGGLAQANGGGKGHGHGGGKSLIPRRRRGLMAYTVRDLITSDKAAYPTLPSGWRELFEAASKIGFTGIEFFSFTGAPSFAQAPGAVGGANPTAQQVRAWLDEFGLRAIGHYNGGIEGSNVVGLTPGTIDAALETAGILGQALTGSHDATGTMVQKAEIDAVCETWNQMAVKAARAGIPIYSHAHNVPWAFLLDSGPQDGSGNYTRSSGVRVMEYFLRHTDPKWVKCEFDVYWAHVAQFQFSTYTAPDGSTVTDVFDPARMVAKFPRRVPILHAKDGIKAPTTENGWIFAPFGWADIDMKRFLRVSRLAKVNPWWSAEQDNAPGGDADPQKSLRDAAAAYQGFATLGTRGGVGAPFAGVPA